MCLHLLPLAIWLLVLDVTSLASLVSSPLMFFVCCSYALSVFTGHKSGRFGHDGKEKLCVVLPCLDCLASPVSILYIKEQFPASQHRLFKSSCHSLQSSSVFIVLLHLVSSAKLDSWE